ncbi:hypothetical protein G7046_g7519 [Stylonectria norvegica]|nr:hypothetical protein G7046_g7519 [Stylonectria norvegica]
MALRILGKPIGPVGFGLMGFHMPGRQLSEEAVFAAIKAAINAGSNYFDAGEFYGAPDNNSLTTLNKYFAKYPEDADKVVVNVKGGMGADRSPNASKEGISSSIENCMRLLGPIKKIDQFEPARKDIKVDYEKETLSTIESYVKAGKIGAISVSEINVDTLRSAAKSFDITGVELELSLFQIAPLTNGLLEAAGELNIPVIAYSPLGRGFLGGNLKSLDDLPQGDIRRMMPRYSPENFSKNLELVHKIEALAQKKGVTTGQIAIGWVRSLSKRPGMPTIIPIPGSTNPDRIKENATVIDLTKEDLAEIDEFLKTFVPAGERYPKMFMKDLEL